MAYDEKLADRVREALVDIPKVTEKKMFRGITFMVDVTQMPAGAFGYVPTPALVAPIEFTMRLSDYAALGGHMDYVRPLSSIRDNAELRPMLIPGRHA